MALIVDHPLRDLSGLVLIALKLCQQGVTCYLVPNNLRQFELWHLLPDFVLENYFHSHRRADYRELARYGVKLGVLDTEGGFYSASDRFLKLFVQDPALRAHVSCYCCWGARFASELAQRGMFRPDQIVLTGCPRLDFYTPGWRELTLQQSPQADEFADNLVLINSVFAAANPGHYSREEAVRTLQDVAHVSAAQARQRQADEERGLRQFARLANQLAKRFPRATVVYRPHPFEGTEIYRQLLEPLPNLHCVKQGSVDGWILRAKAVIQRGCSTSFEAGMAGVPTLAPGWIDIPWPHDLFDQASFLCPSPEQLEARLQAILDAGSAQTPEIPAGAKQLIHDWYYRVDGQSSQRVADAILSQLARGGQPHSIATALGRSLRHWYGHTRRWLRQSEAQVRHIRRPGQQTAPSHLDCLQAWDKSLKRFTTEEVAALVRQVQACPRAQQEGLGQDITVRDTTSARPSRRSRTVVLAPG